MKKHAFAIMAVAFGFNISASAGNNPRIDQALNENLAESQALKAEINQPQVVENSKLNSKYRAVEVLELGDELGGFANSKGLAEETSHKAVQDLE
jgi:hypothetical protein